MGWFWNDSSALHLFLCFISLIITSAPPQVIRHWIQEAADPSLRGGDGVLRSPAAWDQGPVLPLCLHGIWGQVPTPH